MTISRRSFLAAMPLAAAAQYVPRLQRLSPGAFTHGVASGDPLPDSVIIWTRCVTVDGGRVGWEVSQDESFGRVVARGEAISQAAHDFCVKVDVRGLAPGRPYFYRFLSALGPSVVGQTCTAPRGSVKSLTVALFSCANLPFGYFHTYGHAARRPEIDLVLHVGDYFYEYPRGIYPTDAQALPGRVIDPPGELLRLSDYRQRYACYHTDADLLELRRLKAMSVVWDDHEVVNNMWSTGSESHDERTQGSFVARVAAGARAFLEWMPIRRPEARGHRIYRSLDWGDLARILLLDTRLIGRDRQPDYAPLTRHLAGGNSSVAALVPAIRWAVDNPSRSMLGEAQEKWLAYTLAESKKRGQPWQLLAQQLLVGDQVAPARATQLLGADLPERLRVWFTVAEQIAQFNLSWKPDAWAGYPVARARLLEACAVNAANTVILGGDSHNCWANDLPAASARRLAAIEFAGGSVTSPGCESHLSRARAGERERLVRAANPNLAWCDLTNRGYGVVNLTRRECTAEWVAFSDVRSPNAAASTVERLSSAASTSAGPGAWIVSS